MFVLIVLFLLVFPALWMYTEFMCDPALLSLQKWWQAFIAFLSLLAAVAIFIGIGYLPGTAYYDRSRLVLGVAFVLLIGLSAGFALAGRRQQSDLSRRISRLVLVVELLMTSYALLALVLAPAI
jgi:hypothetical protein